MTILQLYKKRVKERLVDYGFKSYGKYHYRVKNDVFQSFCLKGFSSGDEVAVEHIVLPLSYDYEITKNTCGSETTTGHFWYDRKNDESIENCVELVVDSIQAVLIPHFEKCLDCKSAYKEIYEIDKQYRESSKDTYIHDYPLLFMALKCENYEASIYHLNRCIEQTQSAYSRNVECFPDMANAGYATRIKSKLERYNALKNMISDKRVDEIKKRLTENETDNLLRLNWKASI